MAQSHGIRRKNLYKIVVFHIPPSFIRTATLNRNNKHMVSRAKSAPLTAKNTPRETEPSIHWAIPISAQARSINKKAASPQMDVSHMFWELKQHGVHLNHIQDGIQSAVDERMKSERFKTELITKQNGKWRKTLF